jgi:type IV pilus assembly protein PilA
MKLKSGFSLIELLVVVAIIGILAAIGTVGYRNYTEQASAATIEANDAQILQSTLVQDADTQSTQCPSGTAAIACANTIASDAGITVWSNNANCDSGTLTIGAKSAKVGRLGC